MSFLFGSKAQRMFKKIQDLSSNHMVDQAAVMVEEDLDILLSDQDITAQLVPFLMDVGHPDLGARIGGKIMKTHPDLRMRISRLLEDKQTQFPKSLELLRVIWRSRLHQRDFAGLIELLQRTERMTVNRFSDSIKGSYRSLDGVTGRDLGAGIDRVLAWSLISMHKGDAIAAMDILVDASEKCGFPEESLARLSGWIAGQTGGAEMDINIRRIQVLAAIKDYERAIAELPSIYNADAEIISKAIALVEKELIPTDKTPKSKISLARLMSASGKASEACLILDKLTETYSDSSVLEQAVSNLVINNSGLSRTHLVQAKLRLERKENSQALDSIEKAFQCADIAESPIVSLCKRFIDLGIDREGLITGKLGEFLVEQGSVEDAVEILCLRAAKTPDWVIEQLQKLLKRDRTSAAVLTLLAVVLLIDNRGGEAKATLKHLSARKDVKSRQDIASVLSRFDNLMSEHPELRRLRASAGSASGRKSASAKDWAELLLSGEKIPDNGMIEIFDKSIISDKAEELISSGFKPDSPIGELLLAKAFVDTKQIEKATKHLTAALSDASMVERVSSLVASLPFSLISSMKPEKLFVRLNEVNCGNVIEKLLPLLAANDSAEWMNKLATKLTLATENNTAFFRLNYFIEKNMPGIAASSTKALTSISPGLLSLVHGCEAVASGNREDATKFLSDASSERETASLAKDVLREFISSGKASSSSAIALAQAQLKTDDASAAADSLEPFLNQSSILEYLEQAVLEVPSSFSLHSSLALARLYAGDAAGFKVAAGTALEGSLGNANEIVQAAIEYSEENDYADGFIFAAETAVKFIENFDVSEMLIKFLSLAPGKVARTLEFKSENSLLIMFQALIKCDSFAFKYNPLFTSISFPDSILDAALEAWHKEKAVEALKELEILLDEMSKISRAHKLRKILVELGEDSSEGLLNDAQFDNKYRIDFLLLSSNSDIVTEAIEKLYPKGFALISSEELSALAEMLVRSKATKNLFDFALALLELDTDEHKLAAEQIVDTFIPTAGEDDSLSIPQTVTLLLVSGRINQAFELARGDSKLLAEVREKLAIFDQESNLPDSLLRADKVFDVIRTNRAMSSPLAYGEAMWNLGQRVSACSIWREAYSRENDVKLLIRLYSALDYMGDLLERRAVLRLLSEKHPESISENMLDNSSSELSIISFNIK